MQFEQDRCQGPYTVDDSPVKYKVGLGKSSKKRILFDVYANRMNQYIVKWINKFRAYFQNSFIGVHWIHRFFGVGRSTLTNLPRHG